MVCFLAHPVYDELTCAVHDDVIIVDGVFVSRQTTSS